MAGAANNERQDAVVVEVTPGTTPATPSFTKQSFDTINMEANPRTSESFPSSASGQRAAIGRNGIEVTGSAEGKLIYGEYDTFWSSLFQETWRTGSIVGTVTVTTVEPLNETTINVTTAGASSVDLWPGNEISIAGDANSPYIVAQAVSIGASTTGDIVIVEPGLGQATAGAEAVTATGADVLVNGQGQVSFTVEQAIPQGAGSGTLTYLRYRGVESVTATLSMTAREDVEVAFDLLGSGSDASSTTAIAGSTYADPTNSTIIGSGADLGTITMSGFDPLDCMRSCEIDFGVADKEDQPRLSSDDACGINRGAMRPTITGEFYVEDNFDAIYDASRTGTEFALLIPIGSVTTQKYDLYFPKCEFVRSPLISAEDGPAFQEFTILPKYDPQIGGTCRMRRGLA